MKIKRFENFDDVINECPLRVMVSGETSNSVSLLTHCAMPIGLRAAIVRECTFCAAQKEGTRRTFGSGSTEKLFDFHIQERELNFSEEPVLSNEN